MAQPVYPNHETRFPAYPEPGDGPAASELGYDPSPVPVGCVVETRSNLALDHAAERVGNAVGSAVEKVKELPDRLQSMKERFTVIRGRAQRDLKSRATDLAEDFKDQAERTVTQARTRAERLAHEQPLVVILGAAGFGLIMGAALRIWRDHAE